MNEVVDLSIDDPVSSKETDFFDDDEDDAVYAAVDQIEQLRVQQEEATKQQNQFIKQQQEQQKQFISTSRTNLITNHGLRDRLVQQLFPHQVVGVQSAIEKFRGRLLLCDEMGLGKTHQALCIASKYIEQNIGPCLIFCPASLRTQWARHVEQLLPGISPKEIHILESTAQNLISQLNDPSVKIVISSHALSRTFSEDNITLPNIGIVIIDEAHAMRSAYLTNKKNSKQATALARSVIASKYAVLLTGTPIYTSFQDLFAPLEALIGCGNIKTRTHHHGLNCTTCKWPKEDRLLAPCSAISSNSSSSSSNSSSSSSSNSNSSNNMTATKMTSFWNFYWAQHKRPPRRRRLYEENAWGGQTLSPQQSCAP